MTETKKPLQEVKDHQQIVNEGISTYNRKLVKVCNSSFDDYEEMFKGKKITIPGSGFTIMQRRRAVEFLRQYPGRSKEGELITKSLAIREINEPKKKKQIVMSCPNCQFTTTDEKELIEHVKNKHGE
jgi:hypothetical protein